MKHEMPHDYEKKFSGFIKLCSEAKAKGFDRVMVAHPWVVGDNYNEVMESLSRLADAGLALHMADR